MPLSDSRQLKAAGNIVEKRYAEALADIWEEKADRDLFRQEMETVGQVFGDNRDLVDLLVNPCVGAEFKKEVIGMIFTGCAGSEICNFLKLLADKGRIGYLQGIFREFCRFADERSGILCVEVTSVLPLDAGQLGRIGAAFVRKTGAGSVRVISGLDSRLLGGVKVAAGGMLTDGSVKKRLEGLGKILRYQA